MCWNNPQGADALPALTAYLRDAGAQVVLTGSQAETGEGSGMLPFLLAEEPGLAAGGGAGAGRSPSMAVRRWCCKPCLARSAASVEGAPAVSGDCG